MNTTIDVRKQKTTVLVALLTRFHGPSIAYTEQELALRDAIRSELNRRAKEKRGTS